MSERPLGDVGARRDDLAALVERAVATVPFWAEHLGAGAPNRPFTELPTCAKADLAGWGATPLSADPPPPARWCATSGTTGPRLLVGFDRHDWERLGDVLARRGRMVGLGPGDLVANTHGGGLWIGGPTLDLMALGAGAGLLPVGPGRTDQLLAWLAELPITAMSATPSFVRFLAERLAERHVDTAGWSLRIGLLGGEGAGPVLRRQVAERLGVRWQELYGSTEVGGPVLGWSPPDDPYGGRLLLDTDEFVVELLHPDRDEPVGPGEVGELTVSTPHRTSSPLVRYRTRDLTVALPDVADPSGCASVAAIVGRVDDAIKLRGALVYPAALEALVVERSAPGAEWRVVVDRQPGALDTLALHVEHDDPDAGGIADAVHERLGVRIDVTVVAPGSLERFEGKAARLIDRRT